MPRQCDSKGLYLRRRWTVRPALSIDASDIDASDRFPTPRLLQTATRSLAGLAVLALLAMGSTACVAQQPDTSPTRSPVSDTPAPGIIRAPLQPETYEGYPISQLFYDLLGGTGSVAKDRELRQKIENLAEPIAAGPFNTLLAERLVADIRALEGIEEATYSLYASEQPGTVILVISATLGAVPEPVSRGMLQTGRVADFPVVIENERTLCAYS